METKSVQVQIEDAVAAAFTFYRNRNLPLADIICRNILDADPHHIGALNIIGMIAAQLGLREEAIQYFARALHHNSQFAAARDNLARAQAMKPPQIVAGERFLLIKAWGEGFWSDISSVLGALLLAEITGRIPVVHWGSNSLYSDGSGREAFGHYFAPVSAFTTIDLKAKREADYFPAKWSAANLENDNVAKWNALHGRMGGLYYNNRAEKIAVADYYTGVIDVFPWIPPAHKFFGEPIDALSYRLSKTYLKPQTWILDEVDRFHRTYIAGRPTIAVHLRGSDKIREFVALDAVNKSYFNILDAQNPAFQFFLLTDDARWAAAFRERYGTRVIMTNSERTVDERSVHHMSNDGGVRRGTEIMVDTYLALRCDKFLGNGRSNVSAMISVLKPWARNDYILIAPSQLYERMGIIYTDEFAADRLNVSKMNSTAYVTP